MASANDRRLGRKVPDIFVRESMHGTRLDSGPYIGKIKNNFDPARLGRLQVWIPGISGDEDNSSNWRTVSYASPFFGSTTVDENNTNNDFNSVAHSYGMWFTVPDIGNFVICTFIAGDPSMGFWFACIPNQVGQQMVPALGGTKNLDSKTIKDATVKKGFKNQQLPAVEFNENAQNVNWKDYIQSNKRPVHEEQAKVLYEQGLDRDNVRGSIGSNSQRESPSGVFGFSTPGRDAEEKAKSASFQKKLNDKKIDPAKDLAVKARKGGHTFVLDDGDYQGNDQLVRLRTAGGHQILMHDTEKLLYISNSNGSAWIEMTGSGHVNIYAANSVSIRTQADFNFHADKDINMYAGGKINLAAKSSFSVEGESISLNAEKKTTIFGGDVGIGSSGRVDLSAKSSGSFSATGPLMITGKPVGLNSGAGKPVNKPTAIGKLKLDDTSKKSVVWEVDKDKIRSIVKIAPTHEPWSRKTGKPDAGSSSAAGTANSNTASESSCAAIADSVNLAGARADGQIVSNEVPDPAGSTVGGTTPSYPTTKIIPAGVVSTGSGGVLVDSEGRPIISGSADPGIQEALGAAVTKKVPSSYLSRSDNPTPSKGVGTLNAVETKAMLTQLAYTESNFDYGIQGGSGNKYLGKYQFGAAALVDVGLIKPEAYKTYGAAAIEYPGSWTGGITSKEEFLTNASIQENSMLKLAQQNYNTLVSKGAIKPDDDSGTVAGMLSTAHLLGPGGASRWRLTGEGADAFGTTGTQYFNRGRYAVNELAGGKD